MRAQTITTSSKSKRRFRGRGLALALAACALAVPASAGASPVDPVLVSAGDSGDASQTALSSPPRQSSGSGGSEIIGRGHTALNPIIAEDPPESTPVSVSTTSDDGLNWGAVAIGAGCAMALAALAIGVLGTRRRTRLSPSA